MSTTSEIIILFGMPTSGKTTYSLNLIKEKPKFIRINRDDIRKMMFNSEVVDHIKEDLITTIEFNIAENTLAKNKSIIWDNTHLKIIFLNKIIERFKDRANISFKVFDLDLITILDRNSKRSPEKTISEKNIKKMYDQYKHVINNFDFSPINKEKDSFFIPKEKNPKLLDCVLFDIDGTLANKGPRGYFDWDNVDVDHLNPIVYELIDFHRSKGRKIFLLSGRDSLSKDKTIKWLNNNNLYYDAIYMRNTNDNRRDSVVKKEIYEMYIKDLYNVHCVYDDRLQVVDMWYKEGLFVFNVNQGNKIF